jgi:hypothetical protein
VGTRVGKEWTYGMDVWDGMWWGQREKFAIWIHANRIHHTCKVDDYY